MSPPFSRRPTRAKPLGRPENKPTQRAVFSRPAVTQQPRHPLASGTDDTPGGHAMIWDPRQPRKPRGFTRTDLLAALTVVILLGLLQLSAAKHVAIQLDTAGCLST